MFSLEFVGFLLLGMILYSFILFEQFNVVADYLAAIATLEDDGDAIKYLQALGKWQSFDGSEFKQVITPFLQCIPIFVATMFLMQIMVQDNNTQDIPLSQTIVLGD